MGIKFRENDSTLSWFERFMYSGSYIRNRDVCVVRADSSGDNNESYYLRRSAWQELSNTHMPFSRNVKAKGIDYKGRLMLLGRDEYSESYSDLSTAPLSDFNKLIPVSVNGSKIANLPGANVYQDGNGTTIEYVTGERRGFLKLSTLLLVFTIITGILAIGTQNSVIGNIIAAIFTLIFGVTGFLIFTGERKVRTTKTIHVNYYDERLYREIGKYLSCTATRSEAIQRLDDIDEVAKTDVSDNVKQEAVNKIVASLTSLDGLLDDDKEESDDVIRKMNEDYVSLLVSKYDNQEEE